MSALSSLSCCLVGSKREHQAQLFLFIVMVPNGVCFPWCRMNVNAELSDFVKNTLGRRHAVSDSVIIMRVLTENRVKVCSACGGWQDCACCSYFRVQTVKRLRNVTWSDIVMPRNISLAATKGLKAVLVAGQCAGPSRCAVYINICFMCLQFAFAGKMVPEALDCRHVPRCFQSVLTFAYQSSCSRNERA